MGWISDAWTVVKDIFSSAELRKLREENGHLRKALARREGVIFGIMSTGKNGKVIKQMGHSAPVAGVKKISSSTLGVGMGI